MQRESKSRWLHKENPSEWRFIGIWADMLNFNISIDLQVYKKESYLILFHAYEIPLQIIQENLKLRNLYNQYETLFKQSNLKELKDKIKQMDLDIQTQIKNISELSHFCIYNSENDTIINL